MWNAETAAHIESEGKQAQIMRTHGRAVSAERVKVVDDAMLTVVGRRSLALAYPQQLQMVAHNASQSSSQEYEVCVHELRKRVVEIMRRGLDYTHPSFATAPVVAALG